MGFQSWIVPGPGQSSKATMGFEAKSERATHPSGWVL